MEEECLVKETSFDYGKGSALTKGDQDQTPMGIRVKTKKALGKPLGRIDFSLDKDDDDVLLDTLLVLSTPVKKLVAVSVRKFFTLDIGLNKINRKSSQEKLVVIRKLFSRINGFGGTTTPSKFAGIIWATFTSKSSLVKATKMATDANIMVNTNLRKSAGRLDRAVVLKEISVETSTEAVRAVLSKFGIIKSIKMQLQKAVVEFEQSDHADLVAAKWSILIRKDAVQVARSDLDKESWDAKDQHRVLLYTLPMRMTAHNIWDFIGSVGEKMCVINRHPVTYARAKCAVICFDSAESLDAIVETTPVLRGVNLCWSHLVLTKCAKCGKSGHTSLGCTVGGKASSDLFLCRFLSDTDKSKLAAIYAKRSAPVARSVSFGGLSWAKVANEFSFSPLFGRNVSMKSGSSSEIEPSLPVLTEVHDRFATLECSLASLVEQVSKLAKRLDALGPMVSQPSPRCQPLVTPSSQNQGANIMMSEGSGAATSGKVVAEVVSFDVSLVSKLDDSVKCLMETVLGLSAKNIATCNVREMNNPAKQDDVICWHMEKNNLIVNKFDGVQVFISGLESGYLGAGVMVVMNFSLAKHVYKVSKVSAGEVNSLIAKAVNESFFIVLSSNFNKDSSHKCASFKKCLDLGLVNSLAGSPASKLSTWANSRGVIKTIDYVFVSPNLVDAIINRKVLDVSEHFDMNHQAVSMAVGLGGLLDMWLNSFRRQANRD
ncbi:hypothetical protein G9A89_020900 [Geosiphon pyriformis]|nr:hypothetical protein G9A89_020900 [Geosiphon pyriformis]